MSTVLAYLAVLWPGVLIIVGAFVLWFVVSEIAFRVQWRADGRRMAAALDALTQKRERSDADR